MSTYDHEYRTVATKPRKRKSYASLASDGGKPCPTCYAPMTQHVSSGGYTCPTHGKPSKP